MSLNETWLTEAIATVDHVSRFITELKTQAEQFAATFSVVDRGYFTASEDEQVDALIAAYSRSRQALLDIIDECRTRGEVASGDDEYDTIFIVAFAAASVLVDAARFLREVSEDRPVVRRKLNEPVPEFGIPGGTYDQVQSSLFSSRNAWRLYWAIQYFDKARERLQLAAKKHGVEPLFDLMARLRPRLEVSADRFASAKLRTRSDQWLRAAGRQFVLRAVYGLQRFVSMSMSDVYVRRGHAPNLPQEIVLQVAELIHPGDVIVVRKQFALTNYFLPGYWPHAALYLGNATDLTELGLHTHENFLPRWASVACPQNTRRVLESLKDGVRIRAWNSPLASDSLLLIRPHLTSESLVQGLTRAIVHEGKPYDFDFDFRRSDRLVCTEVIYRAYDGLPGVEFTLAYRAGRPNLSGADLAEMAYAGVNFEPVCCFAPDFSAGLVHGKEAREMIARALELSAGID